MSQIFHIFRKDLRRHWPETAITLAALAAYVWHDIRSWGPQTTYYGVGRFMSRWGSGLIVVLLLVSWWFLIFRVVQSEPLVGDRQFWITRPYEWKKLLAAKVLFVLVFINLPLLLAGAFLLIRAGFSPAAHWLGLLWMQLLLTQVPLLPIAALAVVTRNLAQGLLAILGVVLYMAGMIALSELVESGLSSTDASDWLQGGVLTIASVMAIWLQYEQRRTKMARAVLALGAAVILIIFSVTPILVHGDREYQPPAAGSPPSFHASLLAHPSPPKDVDEFDNKQPVRIEIPIQTWGLSQNSFAQVRAVMLVIEAPNGSRWSSGWQGAYQILFPEPSIWRKDFELDRKTFERFKSADVKAHISLAATVFRDWNGRETITGKGEFLVPDVGVCQLDREVSYSIRCVSPLVKPSRLLVRTDFAASTCPLPEQHEEEGQERNQKALVTDRTAYAWEWNGDQGIAEYGISPVQSFELYFWDRDERNSTSGRICAGTPLRISFPTPVERTRIEFEANGINLADYRQHNLALGFSIGR